MFGRVLNTPLDLTNTRESLESIYLISFLGGTALNISIIICVGEFELFLNLWFSFIIMICQMKNICHVYILDNSGPRTDPWGTLQSVLFQ